MRLINTDAPELFKKCYCPQDWSGNDNYPLMIEWSDVKAAPAVDAEPVRHGRWIRQDNTFTRYMCSECESKNHGGHENYCPNCGAKMDLKEYE